MKHHWSVSILIEVSKPAGSDEELWRSYSLQITDIDSNLNKIQPSAWLVYRWYLGGAGRGGGGLLHFNSQSGIFSPLLLSVLNMTECVYFKCFLWHCFSIIQNILMQRPQGQSMPKQLLEKMRIQEVNQRKSSQSQKGGHPETLRAVGRTVSRVKLLKPRRKAALLSLNCFC